MVLIIDTSNKKEVKIALLKDNKTLYKKNFIAGFKHAELLLAAIDKLLTESKVKLKEIAKIRVVNYGESFSALRIGVVTANTLAYSLKIPIEGIKNSNYTLKLKKNKSHKVDIISPIYSREPNITVKKEKK